MSKTARCSCSVNIGGPQGSDVSETPCCFIDGFREADVPLASTEVGLARLVFSGGALFRDTRIKQYPRL